MRALLLLFSQARKKRINFSACQTGAIQRGFSSRNADGIAVLVVGRKESAVSSVVEHYLDTVGVAGSNPAPRTI